LAIGHEGAGGFYVEISLDGLLVAVGLHNPAPDQVDRLRQAVDAGRTGTPMEVRLKGLLVVRRGVLCPPPLP
jgi:uncharacterized protein (DUF2461 family)